MRLFVALDIAPEIRDRIATLIEGLRGFAPEARWVSPASLHLTLKFIGESNQLEDIRKALGAIKSPSIEISFRGAGFFPTARAARVFWIGVEADERLALLAHSVDEALAPLEITTETHVFTPHITLARGDSGRRRRKSSAVPNAQFSPLQKRLDAMPPSDLGTMTAHEFFLYQSKTAPSGAVYTKLARFELD